MFDTPSEIFFFNFATNYDLFYFRYFIAQDAEEVKRVVFFCKVI